MFNIAIPVYYTLERKRKEDKTFLVSLNWYRNAHYHEQNKVKKYYTELITTLIGPLPIIKKSYEVEYRYYYKNPSSDLPNVTPMASKWLNDVLQSVGKVTNDNVKYLIKETHMVVEQDKENPRVEITILEA
jgi:TorA maturation chaperone TorD